MAATTTEVTFPRPTPTFKIQNLHIVVLTSEQYLFFWVNAQAEIDADNVLEVDSLQNHPHHPNHNFADSSTWSKTKWKRSCEVAKASVQD